jgi:hypothetical protein
LRAFLRLSLATPGCNSRSPHRFSSFRVHISAAVIHFTARRAVRWRRDGGNFPSRKGCRCQNLLWPQPLPHAQPTSEPVKGQTENALTNPNDATLRGLPGGGPQSPARTARRRRDMPVPADYFSFCYQIPSAAWEPQWCVRARIY